MLVVVLIMARFLVTVTVTKTVYTLWAITSAGLREENNCP